MNELYGEEIPVVLRMLGVTRVNRDSIDFKQGYFAPTFGFDIVLNRGGYFDSRLSITLCLGWGRFNVKLPFKTKLKEGCDLPRYGISIHGNTFWIYIGGKYDERIGQVQGKDSLSWYLPFFHYEFDGHWIVDKNDKYVLISKGMQSWDFRKTYAKLETYPYPYILRSGEVQERIATVSQEKRKWHRKWFPFLTSESVSIDVQFDGEVGERAGSWKGGTIGCGYEMLPNETMYDTLKRMHSERKFTQEKP